jgi:formiminoglutamase
MKHFRTYTRNDVLNITRIRRYETKLGEKIRVLESAGSLVSFLEDTSSRFILFGIPEDLGVRANFGIGGADTAWAPFISSFVNLQSTDRFTGEEMALIGYFDFSEVLGVIEKNARGMEERIDALRHAVANIVDEEVEGLVKMITSAGKVPIAIGGGHNNAYPLLKGAAKGLVKSGRAVKAQLNAVNLDAHADFRMEEGRHSGNGFRYAMQEGYLGKYAVVGLQENYNAQSILDDLYSNVNIQYIFHEDIFIHEKLNFRQAIAQAFHFSDDQYMGIELDLDVIKDTLSSAGTPMGISVDHARQYMYYAAQNPKLAYLHICEGAESLLDGRTDPLMGKLIACLVADFIKASL